MMTFILSQSLGGQGASFLVLDGVLVFIETSYYI